MATAAKKCFTMHPHMPRIFDNTALGLLPALRATLDISQTSDFCAGNVNQRGWKPNDATSCSCLTE